RRSERRGKSMADDPLSPAAPRGPRARPLDSTRMMGPRTFLGALLASVFASTRPAAAAIEVRKAVYAVRTTLLYGLLRFEVNGLIDETIDRQAGRYEVRVAGAGAEMTSEIESSGVLLDGRLAPLRF